MGTVTPYASIAIWNGITLGLQSYVIISNSSYDTAFQGGFLSDSRLDVFIGGWDSNTGDAVQTNNWFDVLVYAPTGLTSWIWNTIFSKTEYFSLSSHWTLIGTLPKFLIPIILLFLEQTYLLLLMPRMERYSIWKPFLFKVMLTPNGMLPWE